MKNFLIFLFLFVFLFPLASSSCVQRQERSRNADKYDNWKESLSDSLKLLEKTRDLTQDSLEKAYLLVDSLLKDFSYVDNPREVEGYTILKSARTSYPLSRTGLVARISKAEGFELIAVHSGNSFSSITVSDGVRSASTAHVTPDGALNYRTGNITTVLFTGAEADSVANLIATSPTSKFTIVYGGSSRILLSRADAAVVAQTWKLAQSRREVHRLERALPLVGRKIDILCRKIEQTNSTE